MSKLTDKSERLERIKLEKRVQHLTQARANALKELKSGNKQA